MTIFNESFEAEREIQRLIPLMVSVLCIITMLIVINVVLKMYVPLPCTHFQRNVQVLLNYIFSLANNYVSS